MSFDVQFPGLGLEFKMCIRDRASGVPYLVPLNFGMAAGPQSLTLYFHCAPVGTKLDPVSYTHLDVYKRQSSCRWAKCTLLPM